DVCSSDLETSMYTDQLKPESSTDPASAVGTESSALSATAPGKIRVIKRNGTVVAYEDSKIAIALTKAFLAVEGGSAAASSRIRELVDDLTQQISQTFKRGMPSGGTIHIEEIQDQVELALMRAGEHKVALDYVLYREERARLRAEKSKTAQATTTSTLPGINVTLDDGSVQPLDMGRIQLIVSEACAGLTGVEPKAILDEALRNLYDGVSINDVNTSL